MAVSNNTDASNACGYRCNIDTRWADNDIYGHVNNVAYYSYFDSVINRFLIEHGLDIEAGDAIALVIASECQFRLPVAYPETLEVEMTVATLGTSSVCYRLTLRNSAGKVAANGAVTHVFVDRASRRPIPIPAALRTALTAIAVAPEMA